MRKPVLDVLNGQKPEYTPIWLMRQAGRYLPEYRKLREKAENFLNLCLTPEWATEITLQPIRRYGFDAAILFADILLVPMALGVKLEFKEGEGPVLQSVEETTLDKLEFNNEKVTPVYETLVRVKKELPRAVTLIGFCGAPWTVASYMVDGTSKQGFSKVLHWAKEKPEALDRLLAILVDASEIYLNEQINSGAEVLQIFDSWSGLLSGAEFKRFVIEPTRELVKRIQGKNPDIKIIGFPREAKDGYRDYVKETGVDAVSIDYDVDLNWAKEHLQTLKPLQGNLDPALLVAGGYDMRAQAKKIMTTLGPKHIFNLGHGVVPETPLGHVADLVKFVQGFVF